MPLPSVRRSHNGVVDAGSINSESYFRLKEQFFYYKLINSASRRRRYSATFIAEIAEFLDQCDVEGIYRNFIKPSQFTAVDSGIYELLSDNYPIFGAHFSRDDVKDLSKAKAAFRKAATKLHPDMGGSHEDMTSLNAAFDMVLDNLLLASLGDSESGVAGAGKNASLHRKGVFARGRPQPGFWPGSILQYPSSAADFELLLRTELLIAALDIFEEDVFAQHATHLVFYESWRSNDSGDPFSRGSACERVAEIIVACREASLESAHHDLSEQLKSAAEDWLACAITAWTDFGRQEVEKFGKQAISEDDRDGLPFIDKWRAKNLLDLKRRLDSPSSRAETRFQLMDLLQAENAWRRGLIKEKRYQGALKRFDKQHTAIRASAETVATIFRGQGFMPLEHDPATSDQSLAGLVNERNPENAFGKWQLADDQSRAAYLRAFYEDGELDGKMVYVRQRLWITLSSLIGSEPPGWDASRIERAIREVKALGHAAKAIREGQASDHAEDLGEFLQTLADENDQDRRNRLELLRKLAIDDVRSLMLQDIFPLGSDAKNAIWKGEQDWSPLTRVIPSASYFEAATRPLSDLQHYFTEGSWSGGDSTESRQSGIEYYYKHMDDLWEMMSQASDIDSPRKRAQELAPLIRQALDLDVPSEAASEWQIQYFIGRLTGAQTRLREFQAAHDWLIDYFNLPPSYHARSTRSEDETLRKRLARCKRELAK